MEMKLEKLDHSGFIGKIEGDTGKFIAPCVFYVPDQNTQRLFIGLF